MTGCRPTYVSARTKLILSWAVLLLFLTRLASATLVGAPPTSIIDLRGIGYPTGPCEHLFPDIRRAPESHLEFLDSQRLLISFPVVIRGTCESPGMPDNPTLRSIVMDLSGKAVSSLEWTSPEIMNVQAGPDGAILEVTPVGVRLVDQAFRMLQRIELPHDWAPKMDFPNPPSIQLAPSRHGFAANIPEFIGRGFLGYSAYFAGPTPMRQTIAQSTDDVVVGDDLVVAESGLRGVVARPRVVAFGKKMYSCSNAYWFALPMKDHPVCMTSDFQLVDMAAVAGQTNIADVRSMVPGWGSIRHLLCSSDSPRLLLYSRGTRFPVTDAWGFGSYFKVALVDLRHRKVMFRGSFPPTSAVAISPNGTLIAIREKTSPFPLFRSIEQAERSG